MQSQRGPKKLIWRLTPKGYELYDPQIDELLEKMRREGGRPADDDSARLSMLKRDLIKYRNFYSRSMGNRKRGEPGSLDDAQTRSRMLQDMWVDVPQQPSEVEPAQVEPPRAKSSFAKAKASVGRMVQRSQSAYDTYARPLLGTREDRAATEEQAVAQGEQQPRPTLVRSEIRPVPAVAEPPTLRLNPLAQRAAEQMFNESEAFARPPVEPELTDFSLLGMQVPQSNRPLLGVRDEQVAAENLAIAQGEIPPQPMLFEYQPEQALMDPRSLEDRLAEEAVRGMSIQRERQAIPSLASMRSSERGPPARSPAGPPARPPPPRPPAGPPAEPRIPLRTENYPPLDLRPIPPGPQWRLYQALGTARDVISREGVKPLLGATALGAAGVVLASLGVSRLSRGEQSSVSSEPSKPGPIMSTAPAPGENRYVGNASVAQPRQMRNEPAPQEPQNRDQPAPQRPQNRDQPAPQRPQRPRAAIVSGALAGAAGAASRIANKLAEGGGVGEAGGKILKELTKMKNSGEPSPGVPIQPTQGQGTTAGQPINIFVGGSSAAINKNIVGLQPSRYTFGMGSVYSAYNAQRARLSRGTRQLAAREARAQKRLAKKIEKDEKKLNKLAEKEVAATVRASKEQRKKRLKKIATNLAAATGGYLAGDLAQRAQNYDLATVTLKSIGVI